LKRFVAAALTALVGILLAGCSGGSPEPAAAAVGSAAVGTVDSIFPIEEEIRRFRAILGPEPEGLTGGAGSLEELVARFAQAVESADTTALHDLSMTRDEFGWLYYPTTMFTAPPYELAPAMVWFQIENGSSQGLGRLLARLAGRPLTLAGHSCPSVPRREGQNSVWEGCTVRIERPDAEPLEATLFGSIVERGGVFKFVSYTNGF